jgi:hypothetical protein
VNKNFAGKFVADYRKSAENYLTPVFFDWVNE